MVEQGLPILEHDDPHWLSKAGSCILLSVSHQRFIRDGKGVTGYLARNIKNGLDFISDKFFHDCFFVEEVKA
jgi:hypothetical protein